MPTCCLRCTGGSLDLHEGEKIDRRKDPTADKSRCKAMRPLQSQVRATHLGVQVCHLLYGTAQPTYQRRSESPRC